MKFPTGSSALNLSAVTITISNPASTSASIVITTSQLIVTIPFVTGGQSTDDSGVISVATLPGNTIRPYWSVASAGCSTVAAGIQFSELWKPTGAQ